MTRNLHSSLYRANSHVTLLCILFARLSTRSVVWHCTSLDERLAVDGVAATRISVYTPPPAICICCAVIFKTYNAAVFTEVYVVGALALSSINAACSLHAAIPFLGKLDVFRILCCYIRAVIKIKRDNRRKTQRPCCASELVLKSLEGGAMLRKKIEDRDTRR